MQKKSGIIKKTVALALLATMALGACTGKGNVEEKGEDASMGIEDKSKYRVGSQVSDAYVDPAKITQVPEEMIKAKGYEYDREKLNYELVWSDEFDYEGEPDPEKWGYDTGAGGWGNNELQYYTKGENVEVKDGLLVITARKEEKNGAEYTSTRLVSRGKGDFLYGKIEVRAKLPDGRGTWPAIWMLPTDWDYGSWPKSGEIDIMEHVGYDQNVIHYSIHTESYYHSIGTQKTATKREENVSTEFHVYAIEWLPDQIIFSCDGTETFTYKPTKYKSSPTYKEWPFDKRFHLLLNIAVGGNWGGVKGVDENIWPKTMEVDYVRVYQSPEITALQK
ncbi:MAG: glycoside hydrolase family 16 protein [Lachnospiraceae bacterium]|nr:glycoside hydrolase family 16 protein [Lachnospiraceae bacterium]